IPTPHYYSYPHSIFFFHSMHDNVLSTEASDTIVELTGYRLLTTGVILGIGVPKAVYSYNGQALISTTLDWLVGVILALILFWLGVIEAKRRLGPSCPEISMSS
ncbi:hypothetical protein F5888DRAFT_1732474, partial [Russula emetica]